MKTYGAVAIEADSVKMKIVEEKKNGYKTLEDLSVSINLGRDIIHTGRIDRDSVRELANCLEGFKGVLKEYDVKDYAIAATGVIRKASNGRFIIDLISKNLGLNIEIMEEPVERFLTYLSLNKKLDSYEQIRSEGVLFIEVGSTSSELMVFRKSKIIVNSQIAVGVIKLKSLIQSMGRFSGDSPGVLQEYVFAMCENLHSYISRKKVRHFIAYGSNLHKLIETMDKPQKETDALYADYGTIIEDIAEKLMSQDNEFKDYVRGMHMDYEALLCEVIILNHFHAYVSNAMLSVPDVSLRDGMIYAMANKLGDFNRQSPITKDLLSCAWQIAKRYNSTLKHIGRVEINFTKIFDAYKKSEGFSEKDLMIGQLSCILHEIGKFSKQINYYDATYRGIVHANMLGIKKSILKEVAETTMQFFYFAKETVTDDHINSEDAKRIKLALLIALADSMDKSKKQNMQLIDVKSGSEKLKINVSKNAACHFELWEIDRLRDYFLDVFGQDISILA